MQVHAPVSKSWLRYSYSLSLIHCEGARTSFIPGQPLAPSHSGSFAWLSLLYSEAHRACMQTRFLRQEFAEPSPAARRPPPAARRRKQSACMLDRRHRTPRESPYPMAMRQEAYMRSFFFFFYCKKQNFFNLEKRRRILGTFYYYEQSSSENRSREKSRNNLQELWFHASMLIEYWKSIKIP